jgi:hypothetical protein
VIGYRLVVLLQRSIDVAAVHEMQVGGLDALLIVTV